MECSTINELHGLFKKAFGLGEEAIICRAPGRVNLIGEHTDYNDGFVFPMAIPCAVDVIARKRQDRRLVIYSADYDQRIELDLDTPLQPNEQYHWANYPLGVLWALRGAGIEVSGLEMVLRGNVPQGAGLSSSAALEVSTAVVLRRLTGSLISDLELALLCQRAENGFVGMNCGIMDQFISMMGRKDHGLFLDCRSMEYCHIPFRLEDHRIIICQSGVKHALVDSEYNKRRRECEAGVRVLESHRPEINALRDATMEDLTACRGVMDPVVYRRCLHVVAENDRVLLAVSALKENNIVQFGKFMNASHDSLRDDYEVSCAEIDLLVRLARQQSGLLGARITGGGFGGCTVNLLAKDAVDEFIAVVGAAYHEQTGIAPNFYISTAVDGARIIEEDMK